MAGKCERGTKKYGGIEVVHVSSRPSGIHDREIKNQDLHIGISCWRR